MRSGICAGRLAGGVAREKLRQALGRAGGALSHYADFGHSAIYTLKTGAADRAGWGRRLSCHPAGAGALLGERDARGPAAGVSRYAKTLAAWDGKGDVPARAEDFIGLSVDAALKQTCNPSGRPPRETLRCLIRRGGRGNSAYFNIAVDRATDNANCRQCKLARLHTCADLRQCGSAYLRRQRPIYGHRRCCRWRCSPGAKQGLRAGAAGTSTPGASRAPAPSSRTAWNACSITASSSDHRLATASRCCSRWRRRSPWRQRRHGSGRCVPR